MHTILTPSITTDEFYAAITAENRETLEVLVGKAVKKVGVENLPPTTWGRTAQMLDVRAREALTCPTAIPGMTSAEAYALSLDLEATARFLYAAAERRASLPIIETWLL